MEPLLVQNKRKGWDILWRGVCFPFGPGPKPVTAVAKIKADPESWAMRSIDWDDYKEFERIG
jgi:hypothetical protein